MTASDPDTIQPSFAAGEVPPADAGSPAGDAPRVSGPDDETTRADRFISLEGPDVETSSTHLGGGAAPTPDPAETDPLDPTPIDPDLEAPAQEDGPE